MAAAAINLRRLESRSITDAGAAPTMKLEFPYPEVRAARFHAVAAQVEFESRI
jgi:hypothetical protein